MSATFFPLLSHWDPEQEDLVCEGDNEAILPNLPQTFFTVIYIDPPFNTGKVQRRQTLKTTRSDSGTRIGFGGASYTTDRGDISSYPDSFEDYVGFLVPRIKEAHRLLAAEGTLYLHLDYREAHYVKVACDTIFGRKNFLNEIIWAYDYGGKSTRRWPSKHDTILVYVKDRDRYHFDSQAVDREPYMAPGLVTPEKASRGKLPTDVWWHTIVSPTGKEKTGYPTQKPEGVLRRIVGASSREGDWTLDFFAGSGTLGKVSRDLHRRTVLIDESPEAVRVIMERLTKDKGARTVRHLVVENHSNSE